MTQLPKEIMDMINEFLKSRWDNHHIPAPVKMVFDRDTMKTFLEAAALHYSTIIEDLKKEIREKKMLISDLATDISKLQSQIKGLVEVIKAIVNKLLHDPQYKHEFGHSNECPKCICQQALTNYCNSIK